MTSHQSVSKCLQHLAFASCDIFATARAMAAAGMHVLEISPNYYDDLAARFDLGEDLADRLRRTNILYDRDAGGEFFQFYSQSQNFAGGFFFEIVQRAAGYSGYGAANAPFRIAAQKRALRHPAVPRA